MKHTIVMLIAAQYVYESIMEELELYPELRENGTVVLHSVSVSRLLLRIVKKDTTAFYIHLGEQNVSFIPRDSSSKAFLHSWRFMAVVISRHMSIDSDTVPKEYAQIRAFVHELIQHKDG